MTYVLCLHRWVGYQATYDQYELPANTRIRAICTPESVRSLPGKLLESYSTLPSLDDATAVMAEAEHLVALHGKPVLVVALNEGDLLNAASIRERWGIRGDDLAWTHRFRDKLAMLEVAARQSAIGVLTAVPADSRELAEQMAAEHGYPLVLKPRYGTASRGVRILRDAADLHAALLDQIEPMMIQRFCGDPILHVDGWWDGTQIVVVTASRYANNCAGFGPESPLGSIELGEGRDEDRIRARVGELLAAFAPEREIVFHLELFDKGDALHFLEIGARVGGAEIPFLWREVRNIDLVGIAWEIQTGVSTRYRDHARRFSRSGRPVHPERGAWVIARRASDPCTDAETVYWSQPRDPGFAASGVYEGSGTRLRLRSFDCHALERDVKAIFEHLSPASGVEC
ncbi:MULTISPECIES: biotin carboxylase [unclassified Paraburkholderia]|uniref:ATP-grasp domain-containing protein n=1 Tax=unclassified Paraburkholderia TaxID=2615204 RepID=UPI002AB29C3D|nr:MULTISPECIES: biotin carboxylase [unclassified Paraburkholderia]